MDVFLCWSGEASKEVARRLHDWLPAVVQSVVPWMSESQIGKGSRWNVDIAQQLAKTSFGIVCLTPEAALSPWVLFEAGALAKALDAEGEGRVTPLLLGLAPSGVPSPLTAFQDTKPEHDDMLRLVQDLNLISEEPRRPEVIERTFTALWPSLEASITGVLDVIAGTDASLPIEPERLAGSSPDVLEEVLSSLRDQQRQLADLTSQIRHWDGQRRPDATGKVSLTKRSPDDPLVLYEAARRVLDRAGVTVESLALKGKTVEIVIGHEGLPDQVAQELLAMGLDVMATRVDSGMVQLWGRGGDSSDS